jgi:DNA invertase Pin-like site-specific DNA recombinase
VKAAIYARNSKPPKGWKAKVEGEEPPGSWKMQLPRLRRAAEADGHEVTWEGFDVVTGSNPNRPKWKELMALVRGGHVGVVYVVKLDRVMRSLRHFLDVAEDFEKRGAHLIFIDSQGASIRGKDPYAKAMRGNLAVFAELELDLARERSLDVMEVREDGRTYGPRSEKPAGAPKQFGPEHKMRNRDGKLWHDRARCRACKGAAEPTGSATPPDAGVLPPDAGAPGSATSAEVV